MSDAKKICSECGKIHVTWHGNPSCTGHIVDSDPLEPCTKYPTAGLSICRSHGAVGIVRQRAMQKMALLTAQGQIGDLMRECDIPDQDPVQGLLEVVRVSGSMMRLLTVKVAELNEDPQVHEVLVEGQRGDLQTKEVGGRDGFWGLNKDSEMTIHPYVRLLKDWTERYERACKTCLDAGIAERQVKLAESQGQLIAVAVRGILAALNLTPEQWAAAPKIVEAQLRQVAILEGEIL